MLSQPSGTRQVNACIHREGRTGLPFLPRHHAPGQTAWPEALEAACERALTLGARSCSSVHSILKMEPSRRHRFEPDGERSIAPDLT